MADEAVNEAENTEVEETTTPAESPTTETETPQTESQSEEPQVEAETSESSEGDQTPSRKKGAESRIRELVKENKSLKQQSGRELLEQSNSLEPIEGGREYSPEELEQALAQRANAIASPQIQALKQEIGQVKLESDIKDVQSRYERLNPDSDSYDAKLDQKLAEQYQKYGTSVGLADFIDEQMTLASSTAERIVAETDSQVSKQAEEQTVRPTSQSKQEKSPEDMSLAELEAKLGSVR